MEYCSNERAGLKSVIEKQGLLMLSLKLQINCSLLRRNPVKVRRHQVR